MIVLADDAAVALVAAELRAGRPVVVPTDTVYGIAVDPTVPGATDRLLVAKGRPRGEPLAVLIAAESHAARLLAGPMPAIARRLAAKHWPGGLTIVLNRDPGWPGDLADDGTTIGVRCPDHPWVRQLCELMGPVAASSANVHGQPTVTTAAEAAGVFGTAVAIVVDGGHCQGAPSTVVDCTVAPAVVRRSGRVALTPSELA